jgi:NADH-quinone oxidoreductase subunit J
MIAAALFWCCAAAAMAGGLGAALARNLFHAALLLGLCLTGVAGLYLFLDASYLACVQLIVYVGGILVLVLFATLFSADVRGRVQRPAWWAVAAGGLAGLLAAGVAAQLAHAAVTAVAAATAPAAAAPVEPLGDLLVGRWLVPFLAAAALLTVALVAAVALVQRFRPLAEDDRDG